jgi:hypothetical protein
MLPSRSIKYVGSGSFSELDAIPIDVSLTPGERTLPARSVATGRADWSRPPAENSTSDLSAVALRAKAEGPCDGEPASTALTQFLIFRNFA